MNDQSRSRVSCELLKKNRAGEQKFLESGWCDSELEAEQKVFREAAKFYNLLDDQVSVRLFGNKPYRHIPGCFLSVLSWCKLGFVLNQVTTLDIVIAQ